MPYIKQEARESLESRRPLDVGELNYVITRLLVTWIGERPNYEDFNAAIGVLESAKMELYRRKVAPYEDHKKMVNGDVYTGGTK